MSPNRSRRSASNYPEEFNRSEWRERHEEVSYISLWVKYIMFLMNFLFWIFGGLMIAVGLWALMEKFNSRGSIKIETAFDIVLDFSLVLMIVGAVVFILSCAGCIGALRENTCLLKFFSVCLTLIFFAEMALAITAFIFPNKVLEIVKEELSREVILKYRDDDNLRNVIDIVQSEYQCCGVSDNGYKDWSYNMYFNCSTENISSERCAVPYSCCRNPTNIVNGLINIMCGFNTQSKESVEAGKIIFTEGCITAIMASAQRNLYIIAGVALGIGLAQMFVLYLAKTLYSQIILQKSIWV